MFPIIGLSTRGAGRPRIFAQGIMVNTAYHVTFLPIQFPQKASENRKYFKYRGVYVVEFFK